MSPRSRRRDAGALALLLALAGGLAACGVYAPPRRASEVEASRAADERARQSPETGTVRDEAVREDEAAREDDPDGR